MADVTIRPITRLLVANRGEIARRIIRSAHDMGIATVAVYADGDAGAPFVRDADVAIALHGTSSRETYLDAAKVLEACKRSGADAVLPAIELASDTDFAAAANEIGYPVLVKASAGGGGRGMRIVETEAELGEAVEGARREAKASFGDDTVFLERWLTAPRHVELQILGDLHGNLVHLFERECSIQRRHQKIIEEAPSPAVDPDLRGPHGARRRCPRRRRSATPPPAPWSFLLDGGEFWFLEVNTRLQVEHPITEEITGLDLVRETAPHRRRGNPRLRAGRSERSTATRSRRASTRRIRPTTSCPPAAPCSPGRRPTVDASTPASRPAARSASSSTR